MQESYKGYIIFVLSYECLWTFLQHTEKNLCSRLKRICCLLTIVSPAKAWDTVGPHNVTNWSGGHWKSCQPACPHELHPNVPRHPPHHSAPTQNLLLVNGLKNCVWVCVCLCMCVPISLLSLPQFAPLTVTLGWRGQLGGTWQLVCSSPILGRSVWCQPPPLFLSVRWSPFCL